MTIAEVSRKYGVSADTLRYYERVGLLPQIARTPGGIRNYTESDCGWVEYIKCMRDSGMSVGALADYVALFHEGDETIPARKALLEAQREGIAARVEGLTQVLQRLDRKIASYDVCLLPYEKTLK